MWTKFLEYRLGHDIETQRKLSSAPKTNIHEELEQKYNELDATRRKCGVEPLVRTTDI